TEGGEYSQWSPKGQVVFYESPKGIMAVPYTVSGKDFVPGKPKLWTPRHPSRAGGRYRWDVAADGKRLIVVKGPVLVEEFGNELTFLLNFFDEVKRKVK